MKKRISFFILFILVNLAAKAQQEPLFSNYMLIKPVTNPGFTGADKTVNAYFVNRTMFAGFGDGKPVTSVFGVETPIDMFGAKSGIGLFLVNDELGYQNDIKVSFNYSYHRQLQGGTLGGGLNFGFNNFSVADPEWKPVDEGSASTDPLIPDAFSTMNLNVGAGVYYATTEYYLGLSATNLNMANIIYSKSAFEEEVLNYYAPHFYLTGAYNIALPDPLFDLQPTFLLRSDMAYHQLDINGILLYQKKHWGGLGIRLSTYNLASATIKLGTELISGLNFGYAMDVNIGMFQAGATSHELLVTYSFNLEGKRDQKYKSIRYL